MKRSRVLQLTTLVTLCALSPVSTFAQQVHRLRSTPETVAWGYYVSTKQPALYIESGDMVDVTTMITSRPRRLEAAGIPPEEIQQDLRDIVEQVTDRGPGGHILTGPLDR